MTESQTSPAAAQGSCSGHARDFTDHRHQEKPSTAGVGQVAFSESWLTHLYTFWPSIPARLSLGLCHPNAAPLILVTA